MNIDEPIPSMCGIFTYICLISMVNVPFPWILWGSRGIFGEVVPPKNCLKTNSEFEKQWLEDDIHF